MVCGTPFVLFPKASQILEVGLINKDTHKKSYVHDALY